MLQVENDKKKLWVEKKPPTKGKMDILKKIEPLNLGG